MNRLAIALSLIFSISYSEINSTQLAVADTAEQDLAEEHKIKPVRLAIVGGSIAAIYSTFYIAYLKEGWWAEARPMHFEPLESDMNYAHNLDKFGHFYTGVIVGELFAMSYDWVGMSPFASSLCAGITVSLTQILIEIKDGVSPYGYSVYDAAAGSLGGFYAMGKRFIPAMKYVDYKFAYWPNSPGYWDAHRGKNTDGYGGIWFDDYYGGNQTHWLSFKLGKMLPAQAKTYYPEWLAIAFGLGVAGEYNMEMSYRYEYYLSLDYDFEAILRPQKTWSKNLVTILNHIKFPAPAVRLHPNATFFPLHPWYGFNVSF
jgi:hypothetical protein